MVTRLLQPPSALSDAATRRRSFALGGLLHPHWLPTSALCGLLAFSSARADLERRLFDFTPRSLENPIVAVIDGQIVIPLSEWRAYRDTEKLAAANDPDAPLSDRAILDDLINEYLLVDEAYRDGVPDSPRFRAQMEATRTMILTDFLAARVREAALRSAPEQAATAATALADELYEAATIEVSNEAYAIVQHAARLMDRARREVESSTGVSSEPNRELVERYRAILNAAPDAVTVRFDGDHTLTIHQLIGLYAGIPEPRPDLTTPAEFLTMIKPLITPELMALEAVRRGIDQDPDFVHKLVQNRNALLRFHAHGVVEGRANEILNSDGLESLLRDWDESHRSVDPSDSAPWDVRRSRVLADFSVDLCERLLADHINALRAARRVTLETTPLTR